MTRFLGLLSSQVAGMGSCSDDGGAGDRRLPPLSHQEEIGNKTCWCVFVFLSMIVFVCVFVWWVFLVFKRGRDVCVVICFV